jgi:hypothetical protein
MSSFSPKDVAHLCKFNGTNYPFWKFQVSIVLRQFELMDIVTGKEKKPAQTSSGDDSVIASNAARIKTWKQNDYAATSCLITTLEESIQRSLIACKSANEIWDRLVIQFEQTASQNKYYLQQRFYEYSYQQGNKVMDHITEIEAMANQLNDMGYTISEHQLITKVLYFLTPSLMSVVAAWKNVDDDKQEMSLLTSRLLMAESMNKIQHPEETPADTAFFAKRYQVKPGEASSKSKGKPRFCDYCQKNGHLEDRCWKKEKDAKQAKPTPTQAGVAYNYNGPEWPSDYAFTFRSFGCFQISNLSDMAAGR